MTLMLQSAIHDLQHLLHQTSRSAMQSILRWSLRWLAAIMNASSLPQRRLTSTMTTTWAATPWQVKTSSLATCWSLRNPSLLCWTGRSMGHTAKSASSCEWLFFSFRLCRFWQVYQEIQPFSFLVQGTLVFALFTQIHSRKHHCLCFACYKKNCRLSTERYLKKRTKMFLLSQAGQDHPRQVKATMHYISM